MWVRRVATRVLALSSASNGKVNLYIYPVLSAMPTDPDQLVGECCVLTQILSQSSVKKWKVDV